MQKRIYAVNGASVGRQTITEMLVCALLTVGISGVLCAFTGSIICSIAIPVTAVLMSALIAFLRKKPIASHIFHAAAVIVFALVVMICFGAVQSAMLTGVNNAIAHINNVFDKDMTELGVTAASVGARLIFFVMVTSIIAMIVSFIVNKRAVIWLTLFAFAVLIAAMLMKVPGMIYWLPLIFLGWLGCWSLCSAGAGRSTWVSCAGAAVLLAVGVVVMLATGFNGFSVLNDMHEDMSKGIYDIRYGHDTLPHGDIMKAPGMLSGNNNTLTVTMENPEELYLKGFTGGSFESNKWVESKEDAYNGEWSGMLDYFKKNGFSVQEMYADYSRLDGETAENLITVVNTGADRRYIYLPFTVSKVDGKKNVYKDLYTASKRLFGAKKYSFTSIIEDTKPEKLNADNWVNGSNDADRAKYIEFENAYRAFVNDTYLDLDEKTEAQINEVFYKNYDKSSVEMGVYSITSRIRSILKIATTYTESPAELPDKDFIGWFLGDYKKGNSVYYATVAVMAYRAAGIPARYAEGYFISGSDAQNMRDTQKNKIQLSDRNAHAWVEIYRDGIGWVSVEVTPGFYVEDNDMPEVIDISGDIGDIGGLNGHGSEHYTNALSMYSPEKADPDQDGVSSWVRILVILLCLLIIFIAVMYIRYMWLLYIKYERIYGMSKPETANYMLGYICAALAADGIAAVPDNPNGFRQELLTRYDDFVAPEFDRMVSLVRRSSYGGARLRDHELRTIRIFIEKLTEDVYKGKSIFKKFVMKFVKVV